MKSTVMVVAVIALLVTPGRAAPQSPADLFQQGLQKEQVAGDLKGAIAIYERIVREHGGNRAIAARALVQLGSAYEALGRADARSAYERVVRDYAEQSEQVSIARSRLAALTAPRAVAARGEPVVRRVWAGEGVDGLGAPTPDGRYITFVDWESGDLAVRDLAAGKNRRLTKKGPWDKDISFALFSRPSRDGKQVAYTWFAHETTLPELRVIGIEGGESRLLYGGGDLEYVEPDDWSPDGRHILAAIYPKSSKTSQIALISAADGSARVLKTVDWRGPDRMSFSPDGRYIVYDAPSADGAGDERDVFIISSDGRSDAPLVKHRAQDIALGWSPDGEHVLFASDRTGSMSVWLVPVANGKAAGEPILLRRDSELAVTPMGFTRDGAFYYSFQPAPFDIFVASLDPQTGRAAARPVRLIDRYIGSNRSLSWSPDQKSIAYLSQRRPGMIGNKGRLLLVRSLETGSERVVPVQLASIGPPLWSPDGQFILASGPDPKGAAGINRIDPGSGAATLLVPGTNRQAFGWASDRESFFYHARDWPTRTSRILRHNVRTGGSTEIVKASENVWEASASPDGRQIAFPVIDSGGVRVRVAGENGGQMREVYRVHLDSALSCCGGTAWSADGKYLYLSRYARSDAAAARTSLVRVPVDGGPAQEMGIVMEQIQGVRPHPDGRRIAFTAGAQSVEVWVMENFLPKKGAPKGGGGQ